MRDVPQGEAGASAVEYALIVFAVASVIVGMAVALGGVTTGLFRSTETCIEYHDSASCP
jgi:Flp pilus assembly pilin Flp